MIDVDNFKSYNDSFGHAEGDKALQIVGVCLKETLRGADVAARYGGEEFSILLPQTNSEEAETIAERVRERVENAGFRASQSDDQYRNCELFAEFEFRARFNVSGGQSAF